MTVLSGSLWLFQQRCEAFRVVILDQLLQEGEVFFVAAEDLLHHRISGEETCVELGAGTEYLLDDRPFGPEDGRGEGIERRGFYPGIPKCQP